MTTVQATAGAGRRSRVRANVGLAAALIAAAALLAGGRHAAPPAPPPGRVPLAQAWPGAARADLPDLLVGPLLFLDATTVVGTLPTHDGVYERLVIQPRHGAPRELRRVPTTADPQFTSVTAAGGRLVWAEVANGRPWQIWAGDLAGGPARPLTPDAGDAAFQGDQYDLVVAGGRVHWTVPADGGRDTEIRSVALNGGPADSRREDGQWSLSQWPWLADDTSNGVSTTRLRDMDSGRDVEVRTSARELSSCTPTGCRLLVMNAGGKLDHIDLMHPDGSGRRRIAGSAARSAVTDVAVAGRFEILSEPTAYSDVTGTAALLVYDIATGRTVTVSAAAGGVFTHDGMLWWSTGDFDVVWHTLDLRTA